MCNANVETAGTALREVLETLLGRSVEEREFALSYQELGIDSLQMVGLYCEMESVLQMDLKLEEVDLGSLVTPNHTVEYVCQRMRQNEE